MKIEQLLVQHFYITKEVTLQGMGTFRLAPDFVMPMENDKDPVMPENAISFQYNSRATEDDALINYIVVQTHKIKPLASADLDSYLALGKQFLNIGKPFRIEGLGLLEKNQLGEYQFSQGNFLNTKSEVTPVASKEKREETDISFASERKASPVNKKAIWIVVAIVGIGMVGAAAWYFLSPKKEPVEKFADLPVQKQDTTTTVAVDSIVRKPDSLATVTPVPTSDGYSFKVVIKNYPSRLLAERAFNKLTSYGHKLVLYTFDSVTYKVAMPFTRPLADTTIVKDSVRKGLFGGNPYIELK